MTAGGAGRSGYFANITLHGPYPSDPADARWEFIEPVLTSWRDHRRARTLAIGRPPEHDLRQIMNAILYVDRIGIPWRCLPHDFAPWATVYGYFAPWQQCGVLEQLTCLLRRLVREAEGRGAEPSACVLDAQTNKTPAHVLRAEQGTDAGKRIIGRTGPLETATQAVAVGFPGSPVRRRGGIRC